MTDITTDLARGLKTLSAEQLEAVIAQTKKTLRDQQRKDARAEAQAEKCAAAEDEAAFRAAEQDEDADDPLAGDEADDDAEDTRDRGTTATKRGRYWDHHSDEDGGEDSDEATIIVPPQPKKARGAQIVVGVPKPVVNKLSQRRGHLRTTSTSTANTSSPPRAPPVSSNPPSTPARASDHAGPTFTPYCEENSKFSTQGKQSPTSKTLLDTAYHYFWIKIALEDAFPDDTIRLSMAKASFIEACQEHNIPKRLMRFNIDQIYSKRMTDSVEDRASQLRGEVKTKAQGIVSAQYKLTCLSEEDLKLEVSLLLKRGAFHFADTKNRKGMFENTIIPLILAEQWFKRKSAEGAGIYSNHFHPCPLHLFALIITAVECALNDWKTGLCLQATNMFAKSEYNLVYRKHIASLEKYKMKFPVQFARLQEKTWKDAWRLAGRVAPSAGFESDLDDDDFEDIQERQAAGS